MPGNHRNLSRSPGSSIAALGALLSFATVLLFLVDLQARYWDRISSAKTDAQSFAKVLAEHTALTFDEIDKSLIEAEAIRRNSLAGKYAAPGSANAALRQLQRSSAVLVAIGWTDSSGEVLAHSYRSEPPRRNISDLPHFIAQRDSSDTGLFIAPPFRSAATGMWLTAASRRLNDPDGKFAGVVTAPIDQTYFSKIYRTIDIGKGGSVVLLHRAGKVLVREPDAPEALGRSLADSQLLTRYLPVSDVGAYEIDKSIDGGARIIGYKAVPGLPLVVLVTYARSDVLEPWYLHLYTVGLVVATIVTMIFLGTALLVRQTAAVAVKSKALAITNARFDAALSNMPHGLSMFDADERLLVCNARYLEIYGLTEQQVRTGMPFSEILRLFEQRTEETDFSLDPFLHGAKRRLPHILKLANGRIISIVRTPMTDGGWVATHEDITVRALNEKRIAFLAEHDLLTGLANRALFSERLQEAAKRQQRHGGTFTVFMLDLDKFKNVNDTLGHPAGDQLLVEVAKRLSSSLRDTDVLARLGGDEFAIIQENEKNQKEGAISLAVRIIELIEQPFDLNGNKVGIGTSIGMAFAPSHGNDSETLLQKADLALYSAKSGGRNDFRIFGPELTEAADKLRSIEGELRDAIEGDQLQLYYQPIVDLRTLRTCSIEAFVRWQHPSRGLLAPSKFLPQVEKTGVALPLGEWILQRACTDAAGLPAHIKLAVNISAIQLRKGNLFDVILCALVASGLSPERLEIEISDLRALEGDAITHLQTIRQLKNLGVSVVLDNSDAGPCCLKFPFDGIKIDRAFTQGLADRRDCAAMVASMVSLARGLGISTTAKGVETSAQLEAVRAAGIDYVQGYLLARPVPFGAIDLEAATPPKIVA
jgi:diguanylate cyclase (GGDEF)-like protein